MTDFLLYVLIVLNVLMFFHMMNSNRAVKERERLMDERIEELDELLSAAKQVDSLKEARIKQESRNHFYKNMRLAYRRLHGDQGE